MKMSERIKIYTVGCSQLNSGAEIKILREKLNEVAKAGRIINVTQRINTSGYPLEWVIIVDIGDI
jgi:hypothetical protein